MRRVTGTALFIVVSSAPLITATIAMLFAMVAIFIVGGTEALFLIDSLNLLTRLVIGLLLTVFSIVSVCLLLTYHRHGLLVAKAYFLICAVGCAVEFVTPSLTTTPFSLSTGQIVAFPEHFKHLYLLLMAASFGLYLWLFRLYCHPGLVSAYMRVSKNITLIFDVLHGKNVPLSPPINPNSRNRAQNHL